MTDTQYRACWIAEAGHIIKGTLTDESRARNQVMFLKKYRDAWLEDSAGKRIETDEQPANT